uniref:Cytochrome P450 n=1 Tax=Ditylum brightwellii TaxID=49249 RepID=A0A7S4QH99_9STRA|mmetsp:Transcript_2298/g.3031  ORF Transcript_2298/g.3031 Transcript_2298/m.3031 type:complete len:514 (-) Transcript_2298:67-1608(-)
MSVIVITFSLVALWPILVLFYRYLQFLTYPLRNVAPGPKCGFFVGKWWEIRKEPFMQPEMAWIQNITGWNVPFVHYSILFGMPRILVLDKDIVKQVLMAPYGKQPLRFKRSNKFLENVIGRGLLTLEAEDWMRHRQIIQPAFLANSLKEALSTTVPQLTHRLIGCWKQSEEREIDVSSHLSALTLDIIGQVAFSFDFKGMNNVERWAQRKGESTSDVDGAFVQAIRRPFRQSVIGTISFILGLPALNYYLNPRFRRARRALDVAVDEVIQETKKKMLMGNRSLVQLLLQASQGGSNHKVLNVEELRDDAKTFIIAGHETTAVWCNMAVYALVKHPDVQEKVCQDVLSHSPEEGPLDLETVETMEYFNGFLKEVLRMYPPAGTLMRTNKTEENIGDYKIPPGTQIIIPMYLLHRHNKYWEDPEKFLPERWLQTGKDREEFLSKTRYAFLPFSMGGHNCIGQRFATIEAKLIMAELIRNFDFRISPSQKDTKFTLSNIVVTTTRPNLRVVVKSRK